MSKAAAKSKPVAKAPGLVTSETVLGQITRDYGEGIVVEGYDNVHRLPTGVFQVDLALGGGIPLNRVTEVYGKEGSGKTNFALLIIANAQRGNPGKKCVLIDVERTYDPTWGKRLGVDNDALILIRPDNAEQAVDIIDAFMRAEDVILIVLDSIAALTTAAEIEKSAEKDSMAARARVMSKLVNKVTSAFGLVEKEGRQLALLGINQVRMKIGVLYGSPETTPGGYAWKFMCSMRLRLHGTDVKDAKIHQTMWARKKTEFVIKKYKVPIVSISGEYEMYLVPQNKRHIGGVDPWNTLLARAQQFGMLVKLKKGWQWKCGSETTEFARLKDLVAGIDEKVARDEVIRRALARSVMAEGEEEDLEGL